MEAVDYYTIKVNGHIDGKRIGQLDDAEVKMLEDGCTMIEFNTCDQARLHSVLSRIRDLGLVLVLVQKNKQEEIII